MAGANAGILTGQFSNTWSGTENARGEFIHDIGADGKWIRSTGLKCIVGKPKHRFPAVISLDRISRFREKRTDLNLLASKYRLTKTFSIKANKAKGIIASCGAIYRPETPEDTI